MVPGGEVTRLDHGNFTPDIGFAGMCQHSRSGLNLTRFRAYAPSLGRWLSRDPLGLGNMYGYAGGNPISFVDPLGLWQALTPQGTQNIMSKVVQVQKSDLLNETGQAYQIDSKGVSFRRSVQPM
jgi:RHS repeat-associated protein